MIHFAQAVRGQSDLTRIMIKQMEEALDSAQPEAFTEAMFKLAALLISSRGTTLSVCHFFRSPMLQLSCSRIPLCRMRPSAPAPPLLVAPQDVHGARHGNSHCMLGVAAGGTYGGGSTGTLFDVFDLLLLPRVSLASSLHGPASSSSQFMREMAGAWQMTVELKMGLFSNAQVEADPLAASEESQPVPCPPDVTPHHIWIEVRKSLLFFSQRHPCFLRFSFYVCDFILFSIPVSCPEV